MCELHAIAACRTVPLGRHCHTFSTARVPVSLASTHLVRRTVLASWLSCAAGSRQILLLLLPLILGHNARFCFFWLQAPGQSAQFCFFPVRAALLGLERVVEEDQVSEEQHS